MERITPNDLKSAIAGMAMLKYFPSEPDTRAEISGLLARIVPHAEALRWLTHQLLDGVGEWPGPAELRRILESRYAPADRGSFSQAAPDDIDWSRFPSHVDEGALAPASTKMLSAAECVDRPDAGWTDSNLSEIPSRQ